MAIQYVGQATGTTSATLPPHESGDIIFGFAYRDGATQAPTVPSGVNWTTLAGGTGGGGTANSYQVVYKVASSDSETTGTFTNATSVAFLVYRGQKSTSPLGNAQSATGSSATVAFPSLTLVEPDKGSWVIAFAGHRTDNAIGLQNNSSKLTNRAYEGDATDTLAGYDTNGHVTEFLGDTLDTGVAASNFISYVIELEVEPMTIAGDTSGAVTVSVSLGVTKVLTGYVSVSAAATGAVTITKPLALSVSTSVSVTGQVESYQDIPQQPWDALLNGAPFNVLMYNEGPLGGQVQNLASSVSASALATANVTKDISVASSVLTNATVTAAVSKSSNHSASVSCSSTVTADSSVTKPLAGSVSSTVAVSGTVSVDKPLATELTSDTTVTASAALDKNITAAADATLSITAQVINVDKPLTGSAGATVTVDADTKVDYVVASSVSVDASAEGFAVVLRELESSIAVTASVTADSAVDKNLASAISVSSDTTGATTVSKPLNVSASASATATADIKKSITIAGSVSASGQAAAATAVTKPLAGAMSASAASSGAVSVAKPLGATASIASVIGGDVIVEFRAAANAEVFVTTDAGLDLDKGLAGSGSLSVEAQGQAGLIINLSAPTIFLAAVNGQIVIPRVIDVNDIVTGSTAEVLNDGKTSADVSTDAIASFVQEDQIYIQVLSTGEIEPNVSVEHEIEITAEVGYAAAGVDPQYITYKEAA